VSNALKELCLHDELNTAYNLIEAGFGELQEIDMGNDFYHLPHQLLASGLERLMKCYICLIYEARNGSFPDTKYMKELGHDLLNLLGTICREYFNTNDIPLLNEDYSFLVNDEVLKRIIHILSEFGKFARYYNLDVVTGRRVLSIDPKEEWGALEKSIEDPVPYLGEDATEALHRDYYPRVHSQIIAKLERFIRAIAMQFTHGGHGEKLRRYSIVFTSFAILRDEEFGTSDYRRSVKILKKDEKNWSKRTELEILASPWPTRKISKFQYPSEWPFRSDQVIIECRETTFCIVNINGYDFALNGSAASRYKYLYPHDAGMAVLGKSIGPFIDMAFDLGKSSAGT